MPTVTYTISGTDNDCMSGSDAYAPSGTGSTPRHTIDDYDTSYWRAVSYRWTGISIPAGATITSATLTLSRRSGSSEGGNGTIRFRAQASATPAVFSSGDRPYNRSYRTAYADHAFPANNVTQAVDVTAVIQDLVDTYGAYDGSSSAAIVLTAKAAEWGLPIVSWRVISEDVAGSGAVPAELSITYTAGASPPAAPSGLAASPQSATQINLSWTDNASDETGYTVERSAAGAGSWSVLTSSLPAGSTSYSDTAASANTAYDYRVKATNGAGSSAYATASGARTYPGAPTSPGATATSASAITVSWTAPSGGATSYKVERSPNGSSSWTQIASGVAGTSYGDTGLTSSTTYYYRVRATNATGDGAYSSNASATTQSGASVPDQVTGLSATAASSSQINLSWSAAAGATSYKVERSPNGSSSWTQLVSGHTPTSYSSTGLSAGTTYYYRVRATNAQGDGAYSDVASATTSGSAPSAPTGVSASAGGSDRITVAWTAPAGADSQRVERSANGTSGWANVSGSLSGSATSYLNTGLSASTTYYYRVVATNTSGDSPASSVVNATTSAAGAWRSTDVYWEMLERFQPVLVTATAGVGYLAVCQDAEPTGASAWRWFAGPLLADGVTLTEVASQAAAQAAALSLPTAATGRWDLPSTVGGRTVRLWSRDALTLREFYAERVVEGDLIRAGSVKTLHLAAAAVTADKIFGTTLAAIKAQLGIVTLGTGGGLWQGAGTFAAPTTGLKIWNDTGVGRLATYRGGAVQVELDTTGALRAGQGTVTLDEGGLALSVPSDPSQPANALKWSSGADTPSTMITWAPPGSFPWYSRWRTLGTAARPNAELEVIAQSHGGAYAQLFLNTSTPSATLAAGTGGGAGTLTVGASATTLTTSLTVQGALFANAAIAVTGYLTSIGEAAGLRFADRISGTNWTWYASGTARLGRAGSADALTLDAAGNTTLAGSLTAAGGNHVLGSSGTAYHAGAMGVRTAVQSGIALTVLGASTGTGQYGLAVRDSAGVNNLYVRDDGEVYVRGALTAGDVIDRSDARLKAAISPLDDALGTLDAIPVRQWRWADDPDGPTHYGPIAQDVELVAPELVVEGRPGPGERLRDGHRGILSLHRSSLVGLQHRAIQQLHALILALTDRIAALEAA